MGLVTWGLLGPENIANERRTRTLGLGACVRTFNDLAVPGFGGIWFGKQLLLATLGVAVAERVRSSGKRATNIEVANAVEALACWLALDHNKWRSDPRVRGATKMRTRSDLSFSQVRKRSFYVTQPMRQATIQPLRAFGLVESSGERFSSFACSAAGEQLIEEACGDFRPYNRSVLDHLVRWAKGDDVTLKTRELRNCLSPIEAMSKTSREFLWERSVAGSTIEARRRRNAILWMEQRRANPEAQVTWDMKPEMLDEEHWHNLNMGSLFFVTRDAAIALLDQIEAHLGIQSDQRMSLDKPFSEIILLRCQELRKAAQLFLNHNYDPSPNSAATIFCRECNQPTEARVIESLLSREGRVLQKKGNDVIPGAAFRGTPVFEPDIGRSDEESGEETPIPDNIQWPQSISHRVRNLFLFNLDRRGELSSWLEPTSIAEAS